MLRSLAVLLTLCFANLLVLQSAPGINQQGRVYQKNLGPITGKLASAMTEYNPDPSWKLVPTES